jgi:DNA-binding CsgD family transcriptional regulator
MERLSRRDLRALLEFVRDLHGRHDLDGLGEYVLRGLPRVVRSEITAYNEINPRRRRIAWRDEPSLASAFPEGREVFQRHMADHPLIRHYQRSGDGSARKISDFLTLRQFRELGLYREFFARLDGGDHQMVIALAAPPPLVIGISLNRDHRDFTERDRAVMNLLRPHVLHAYRTAERAAALAEALELVRRGVDRHRCGLIVVAPDGQVRLVTQQARRWIGEYLRPGRRAWSGRRLPGPLEDWVRRQEAGLAPDGDAPRVPAPAVIARGDRRLVIRLVFEPGARLLLLEEQGTAPRAASLEAHGLTRREAEVLGWVARGKTNAEIATILGARDRTVAKHLERTFRKLGVETRTAAAMRALELSGAAPAGSPGEPVPGPASGATVPGPRGA